LLRPQAKLHDDDDDDDNHVAVVAAAVPALDFVSLLLLMLP